MLFGFRLLFGFCLLFSLSLLFKDSKERPPMIEVDAYRQKFYPDGVPAAMVKADVGPAGEFTLDNDFYVAFPDGYRSHQIRLEGGDCSTDSFCYPSV